MSFIQKFCLGVAFLIPISASKKAYRTIVNPESFIPSMLRCTEAQSGNYKKGTRILLNTHRSAAAQRRALLTTREKQSNWLLEELAQSVNISLSLIWLFGEFLSFLYREIVASPGITRIGSVHCSRILKLKKVEEPINNRSIIIRNRYGAAWIDGTTRY